MVTEAPQRSMGRRACDTDTYKGSAVKNRTANEITEPQTVPEDVQRLLNLLSQEFGCAPGSPPNVVPIARHKDERDFCRYEFLLQIGPGVLLVAHYGSPEGLVEGWEEEGDDIDAVRSVMQLHDWQHEPLAASGNRRSKADGLLSTIISPSTRLVSILKGGQAENARDDQPFWVSSSIVHRRQRTRVWRKLSIRSEMQCNV